MKRPCDAAASALWSGQGLLAWDAASITKEKQRYEQALQTMLQVFEREGLR
jgi:hypothetical protein